jgi:hypothetical protein
MLSSTPMAAIAETSAEPPNDRSTLWNAPSLPSVFRTTAAAGHDRAGDSAIVELVCDAAAATLPATIEARCASRRTIALPVALVPIGFDVTGGEGRRRACAARDHHAARTGRAGTESVLTRGALRSPTRWRACARDAHDL